MDTEGGALIVGTFTIPATLASLLNDLAKTGEPKQISDIFERGLAIHDAWHKAGLTPTPSF